nr:tetratricopeptide repeat protein [uncultured Dorea sp.]
MSAVYDWYTFKRYHGGVEGARACFEKLMEELLRKENPSRNIKGVRLAQGDGGIDVFVGNIGQEKIDIYQCKYFDSGLRSSQWKQITDSYNSAIKNQNYQMNKWILCLPAELSLDEHIKWEEWKKEHKVDSIEIGLVCGNEIIDRLSNQGLCDKYFQSTFPKYISKRPHGAKNCMFRDNEVNLLKEELEAGNNILIYGEGGYGKTSLAILLFELIKDDYCHMAWVSYEKSFIDSLLNSLTIYEGIEREKRIELICDFLRQQDKNTIIFLDNLDEQIQDDEYMHELEGCVGLVITSRLPFIENFMGYHIESKSIEECRKIFELYYHAPCNIEEDVFNNFIEYIEQNILFIELVAKTARYAEKPLNDYIKEIVTTGLSISEDEIYSSYDQKTNSLINRLKHLYTLQKMTAEEQEILEKFALTPNLYVPFQYREWAGIKKDKLVALINRGWIDKSEDGYKMHPLIKESILQQEAISISTFEELIDSISNNEFWHCNDEYNKRLIKKQIAKKIIDYFIDVDYKKILDLIIQYSHICIEFSEYKESITVLTYTRELCEAEENYDERILLSINLAIAYSYFHGCNQKEAVSCLKAIDEMADKIQLSDDDLFDIYNLHIMTKSYFGEMENAKQYFNKICELKITERDFMTAMFNYTSGLIKVKKMDESMFYMMKFKECFEKEYSNHEAYLATFYSNLAIAYADKDDFQQALAYDQKAYDIRKRVLGTYSKDMAITYISLAEDYLQFNRNDEAKDCIIKAEEICKVIFENEDNEFYQNVIHAKHVLGILD